MTAPDELTDRDYAEIERARQRANHIKTWVFELATAADVHVTFQATRRAADITVFTLTGNRSDVLELPARFTAMFQDEDLEIIRSEAQGMQYRLRLVITEKLGLQQVTVRERRAKLRFHQVSHVS